MRQPASLFARAWLIVPLLALGFIVWMNGVRIQRAEHIAALSRSEVAQDATSPTGYAGRARDRVLLDHDGRSYEWIAQTQRMLGQGEWRVRRVENENAPFGRETHVASPYRWWLGLLSWVDHELSGRSVGQVVERSILYADPLLHLLLLSAITVFAARYHGGFTAAVVALSGVGLFPFAARFLPGIVDEAALEAVCVLGSLLALLAGISARDQSDNVGARQARYVTSRAWRQGESFWFSVAGVFGGVGLWMNPASQTPLIGGIFLGGLFAAWLRRTASNQAEKQPAIPWRVWSLSGAITVLLACLLEYFPDHLSAWEFRAVHPLYGLAWIGGGELLARIAAWMQTREVSWKPRDVAIKLLSLLAVAALPLAMHKTGNPGFLAVDALFFRLTNEPGGVLAPNLWQWIQEDGLTWKIAATLLPLLLLLPALRLVARRATPVTARMSIAILLGAVLLAGASACLQIRHWLLVDAVLLALLIPVTSAIGRTASRPSARWMWGAAILVVLLPGIFQVLPSTSAKANAMELSEAVGLVERDLAHWLAKRTDAGAPPLVLAPPKLTTSLIYYGGLRGVATLSWENTEGLSFAIRNVISTSRNETAALLRQRGVTHILIPSWDRFFDSYLQAASVQLGEMFHPGLERWNLPSWLRAIPYQLPSIPGWENQTLKIFEVVDDQAPPIAAARLTEYFVEMGQLENAIASHEGLSRYPADFSVLVARAQLWAAVGDVEKFTVVFKPLLARLEAGGDRYMLWDRRVSLAVVLAKGDRMDLAQAQVARCLAEIDEPRLRSLTTNALYYFLAIGKATGLEIADPELASLALSLLPAELRQQL